MPDYVVAEGPNLNRLAGQKTFEWRAPSVDLIAVKPWMTTLEAAFLSFLKIYRGKFHAGILTG